MSRFEALLGIPDSQRLYDGQEDKALKDLGCWAKERVRAVGVSFVHYLPWFEDRNND